MMVSLPVSVLVFLLCGFGATNALTSCQFSGEGAVRLEGFSVSHAGRVEVCKGDYWGSVCIESTNILWSLKNAQVVCKQLGYVTAINSIPATTLTFSERASSSDPIHYSQVVCDGSEGNFSQCSMSTSTGNCTHLNDAVIACRPGSPEVGDVRLVGHTADYIGAVEYYNNLRGWTGICADSSSWNSNTEAARIVCRQLGYEGGRPYSQSISYETITERVSDIECSFNSDFTLSDCSVDPFSGCSSDMAGWVECEETDASDYSIRLVGGSREGVVEVAFNGRWGTICDSSWFSTDAQVACEELGLTTELFYSTFPSGIYDDYMSRMKPFWLSGVSCVSSDDSIEDCSRDVTIGYSSSCNTASSFLPDSAEIDCGEPESTTLSGGAIAGIVIASIAAVFLFVMAIIYVPQYWKKRHQYSWWNTLSTPSSWFDRCNQPRSRTGRAAVVTLSSQPEYPPATYRPTREPESQPEASQQPAPTLQAERERGAENVFGGLFSPPQNPPPAAEPEPQGDLTAAAPPPYQAAVSYPTATPQPQPPAYSEKTGAYPDPSAAYPPQPIAPYPPPQPSAPPLSGSGHPPPVGATFDAAYPPPLAQASAGGLPYPN